MKITGQERRRLYTRPVERKTSTIRTNGKITVRQYIRNDGEHIHFDW